MLARLREEIQANHGWIAFARYMELVLYDPGLGYYAGGAPKLGAAGDFVTAPELGSLFGRTLARQLQALAGPILEFGAGSGALAATLLAEHAFDYRILEISPQLELAAAGAPRQPCAVAAAPARAHPRRGDRERGRRCHAGARRGVASRGDHGARRRAFRRSARVAREGGRRAAAR